MIWIPSCLEGGWDAPWQEIPDRDALTVLNLYIKYLFSIPVATTLTDPREQQLEAYLVLAPAHSERLSFDLC